MSNIKKALYLHVGYFKTGTSFIQKFLSDNAKSMLDYGICYPAAGRPRNNLTTHSLYPLKAMHESGRKVPRWFRKKKKNFDRTAEEVLNELVGEAVRTPCDTVIISSEEFVRFSEFDDPVENIRMLKEAFSQFDVRIILYLREPVSYLESWYNQGTKTSPTPRFSRFFLNIGKVHTDYADVASHWISVFGAENVLLKPYTHAGASHIIDFLSETGKTLRKEAVNSMIPQRSVNAGLEPRTLEVKRVSSHAAAGRPFWRFLANFDNRSYIRKNKEVLERHCDKINQQMKRLEQEYGFDEARKWTIDLSRIRSIEEELNNLIADENEDFQLKAAIYYERFGKRSKQKLWQSGAGSALGKLVRRYS